jgi:hypothetical protein
MVPCTSVRDVVVEACIVCFFLHKKAMKAMIGTMHSGTRMAHFQILSHLSPDQASGKLLPISNLANQKT